MSSAFFILLAILVGLPLAVLAVIYLFVPFFKGVGWLFAHIGRYLYYTLTDAVRFVGCVVTWFAFCFLALGNVVIGRWSAAQHFGRSVQGESAALVACTYRLILGHPLRLFYLHGMVEGLEHRVPAAVAAAPGPTGAAPAADAQLGKSPLETATAAVEPVARPLGPSFRRAIGFDGYTILGTLAGGGSGGRLYIARPDEIKTAQLEREGFAPIGDVVIKSFSVSDGSSLPQIVRESRALEAARKLGLVLEHDMTGDRFHYVMRYVPGDSLSLVTHRLHAASGPDGLSHEQLTQAVCFVIDLVATLDQYHRAGLWHKDIKPDNIIVHAGDGRAHLVDFGLVTPLRSGMTLTTHGTEYFRDPEMVRLALRGVKVHEVDGARFDVYGAGAVLYAVLENSFPAHGALSHISKAVPEPLRWVVRRAMTDYDKRYPSASTMLSDLLTVLTAAKAGPAALAALRVADLPSVTLADSPTQLPSGDASGPTLSQADTSAAAPPGPVAGRYSPDGETSPPIITRAASPLPRVAAVAGGMAATAPVGGPRTAAEQLASARRRVAERRAAAHKRMRRPFPDPARSEMPISDRMSTGVNAGVLMAGAIALGFVVLLVSLASGGASSRPASVQQSSRERQADPEPPLLDVAFATADSRMIRRSWQETATGLAQVFTGTVRRPDAGQAGNARRHSRNRSAQMQPTVENVPVLVFEELASAAPEHASRIKELCERLRRAGFRLLTGDEQDAALRDRVLDLKASALRARGTYEPRSTDAVIALQHWLSGVPAADDPSSPTPQLILWFDRHPDDAARTLAWAVPAPTVEGQTVRAAMHALGTLLVPSTPEPVESEDPADPPSQPMPSQPAALPGRPELPPAAKG